MYAIYTEDGEFVHGPAVSPQALVDSVTRQHHLKRPMFKTATLTVGSTFHKRLFCYARPVLDGLFVIKFPNVGWQDVGLMAFVAGYKRRFFDRAAAADEVDSIAARTVDLMVSNFEARYERCRKRSGRPKPPREELMAKYSNMKSTAVHVIVAVPFDEGDEELLVALPAEVLRKGPS